MNLVSFALRRPITILVLAIAVMMTGLLAIERMPRDVFPNLGVPVLYVAQPYGGMDPAQMEGFIVNYYEYHFLYITGIEHVESKSIQGVGLVKLQFQPGTDMAGAMAETVSYVPARSCRPEQCHPSSCASTPAACRSAIWSSRTRAESWASRTCRTLPSSGCVRCLRPCRAYRPHRHLAAAPAPS